MCTLENILFNKTDLNSTKKTKYWFHTIVKLNFRINDKINSCRVEIQLKLTNVQTYSALWLQDTQGKKFNADPVRARLLWRHIKVFWRFANRPTLHRLHGQTDLTTVIWQVLEEESCYDAWHEKLQNCGMQIVTFHTSLTQLSEFLVVMLGWRRIALLFLVLLSLNLEIFIASRST